MSYALMVRDRHDEEVFFGPFRSAAKVDGLCETINAEINRDDAMVDSPAYAYRIYLANPKQATLTRLRKIVAGEPS